MDRRQEKMNALYCEKVEFEKALDSITNEYDYIMSELRGCKFLSEHEWRKKFIHDIDMFYLAHIDNQKLYISAVDKRISDLQDGD
jgi:hypothetical protein